MSTDDNQIAAEAKKKDDEDRGIFGWLYRWYDRYDTWSGRYDWFNWIMGFFKAHTVATVATTGVAAVAVGGAVVLSNPELRDRWLPPKQVEKVEQPVAAMPAEPVAVTTQRWGSSVIFPIEGKDLAQRRASFDVAVLPKDLTWARKSATDLAQADEAIPASEAPARIFTPELREGLSRSAALIAVGLASQEGQVEEETERARQRAASAAGWLSTSVGADTPIWTLNLGQFRGGCQAANETADTSWQRPVIIVGIHSQQEGVNLSEAFADAISGKSNLPSRDCYTNFDMTRFR
ncbi:MULTISPECIES: hypothetical protein [Rhodomicrobium]|uniref:hypothetical protein n=1 Tax=Rhodomicrobium TaxID=1068 RepID=UPI000B4B875E|nr:MULTISPECIES: hypothetical protein [Rhodomicrobium]